MRRCEEGAEQATKKLLDDLFDDQASPRRGLRRSPKTQTPGCARPGVLCVSGLTSGTLTDSRDACKRSD